MLTGAITAMITPFRDGQLDEARLISQIAFQIDNGIDGLVPLGTTGESPTVTHDERARILKLVIKQVAGRVPVIAGVGANSTSEAITLHRQAKQFGADAGLSVCPYYNKPTQEGLYRHFMMLADSVDLPMVLYNVPGRAGVMMSAQTVARLASHSNIVAIKEASGSVDQVSEIMSLCELPILSGDDSLTVPMMAIGAVGVISVVSNIFPDRVKQMTSACAHGDFATARAMHRKLFAFTKAIFADGSPGGIKCAMKLANLDSGETRLPIVEVSDNARQMIAQHLPSATIGARSQQRVPAAPASALSSSD